MRGWCCTYHGRLVDAVDSNVDPSGAYQIKVLTVVTEAPSVDMDALGANHVCTVTIILVACHLRACLVTFERIVLFCCCNVETM